VHFQAEFCLKLRGLSAGREWHDLQVLLIPFTPIAEGDLLDILRGCTGLRSLTLHGVDFAAGTFLSQGPADTARLQVRPILTSPILAKLCELEQLTYLDIGRNILDDNTLAGLAGLSVKTLKMNGTEPIKNETIRHQLANRYFIWRLHD